MQLASAGPPVEVGPFPVGRRSVTLHDAERDGRRLEVEIWHPAVQDARASPLAIYEVLPGVAFTSSAAHQDVAVRDGRVPLILLSHGRTGNRLAYSGLCQALAGRGAIVVVPDHPGDVLTDWLSGNHADDRTNEINRLADAHFLLAAMLGDVATNALDIGVPADVRDAVDHDRIAIIGHSYGAYTAFAAAAGARGVGPHEHVRAVVGLQPYTRAMSDGLLGRVELPALLVVSELDRTTPPASDAERPWALLRGAPTWRVDVAFAGHHASSDVPLYAELVQQILGVPDLIRQYLEFTAAESAAPGAPPWRETQARIVRAVWAFLEVALDLDPISGCAAATELARTPGLQLRRR
jgi:predicted dienelactone hydrolase